MITDILEQRTTSIFRDDHKTTWRHIPEGTIARRLQDVMLRRESCAVSPVSVSMFLLLGKIIVILTKISEVRDSLILSVNCSGHFVVFLTTLSVTRLQSIGWQDEGESYNNSIHFIQTVNSVFKIRVSTDRDYIYRIFTCFECIYRSTFVSKLFDEISVDTKRTGRKMKWTYTSGRNVCRQ